jgi:hypothetical protein
MASQMDHPYPFDVCAIDGEYYDCETITVTVAGRLLFLPLLVK